MFVRICSVSLVFVCLLSAQSGATRRQTITWEQNQGQFPAEIQYMSRGGTARAALTRTGARLLLPSISISMDLVGAAPATLTPADPRPGRSNYIAGSDPAKWITGARHFGRVRYAQVYPGVDLEFHAAQRELEFDFVVAPLADPGRIEYRLTGASAINLRPDGDLSIRAGIAEILQRKPRVYQRVDGEMRTVAGAFELRSGGRVGFHLGPYDHTLPLVIDPVVFTLVFDTLNSMGNGIAVDDQGNSYLAGQAGSGFPDAANAGAYAGGRHDAYVLKLSPAGDLLFATYLGGSGDDQGGSVAIDSAGNIYLGGQTDSADFPVTADAAQKTKAGGLDAFIARLDDTGKVVYCTYYGGTGDEYLYALASSGPQSVFAGGLTMSSDLKTKSGKGAAIQATYGNGGMDAFAVRFDTATGAMVYSTYLGGDYLDEINHLTAAPDGSVYAGGDTGSLTFPGANGTTITNSGYSFNGFVAKITPDGSALTYCTMIGGGDYDAVRDMALASDGTLYFSGGTASTDLPVSSNALQKTYGGQWMDGFLGVLDPSGKITALTYLGGPGIDTAVGVGLEADGTLSVNLRTSDPTGIVTATAKPKPYAQRGAGDPEYQYLEYKVDGKLTRVTNVFDYKLAPGTNLEHCYYNSTAGYGCCSGYFIPAYGDSSTGPFQSALLCASKASILKYLTSAAASNGASPAAGDPVSTATGEMYSSAVDLNLGGIVPVHLIRYYSSALSTTGATSALGTNWMTNFDVKLTVSGTDASVLQFGGNKVKFTKSGDVWKASAARFDYQLLEKDGGYRFLNPGEKLIYVFNSAGVLVREENRNGYGIDITQSADGPTFVTDNLGRTLQLAYTDGLLSSVTDSAGRVVKYSHDGTWLTVFEDALAQSTVYDYAAGGLLTSTTMPAGNVPVTQTYDDKGRVATQTDALGNATLFSIDGNGTATLTDALQQTLSLLHGPLGGASKATNEAGDAASAEYDSAGRLIKSVDLAGDKSSATYDAATGLPATATDASGGTGSITYATQTQDGFTYTLPAAITAADGATVAFEYDGLGNVISMTDARGKKTTIGYNSRALISSVTRPTGETTAYAYNDDATLKSITLPSGNTNTFSYDSAKRRTRTTLPDGTSVQVAFDDMDHVIHRVNQRGDGVDRTYTANGMVASASDALGASVTTTFDANDRSASVTNRSGATVQVARDALGRVTTSTGPTGLQVVKSYDPQGREATVGDAAGVIWTRTYDKAGRPTGLTDALNRTWAFGWDARRNLTSISNPSGSSLQFGYDSRGRITDWTEPSGPALHYAYDAAGALSSVTRSGGVSIGLTRDDSGRVTGITDANGKTWSSAYDAAGRLAARSDPLGNWLSVTYDNMERPAHLDNPMGSVDTTYDAAGMVVRRQYSDGTDLHLAYDKNSRLTSADGLTLGYDPDGRVVASNGLGVTRDGSGRITSITYAEGRTVQYAYDNRGLLSTVTDWLGGITSFYYDQGMELTAITRPNGVTTTYSYDVDGQLNGISEEKDGPIASTKLVLDGSGKVTSAERNLPAAQTLQDSVQTLEYDEASQVASFTYDSMGQVTADASRTYAWDLAARLKSWSAGDASAQYSYDAFGMMTGRTTPATARTFVINYALDMPSVATERVDGADDRYYICWPDGRLLYSVAAGSGSRNFYHFDESGNTTMLTDDSGAVAASYAVTPFGEVTSESGSAQNPYVFQGEFGVRREASDLYYMRARFYDAGTARFLSRDPVVATRRPLSVNPYQYAELNPLTQIDPMGLSARSTAVPSGAPFIPQTRAYSGLSSPLNFAYVPAVSLADAKSQLRGALAGAGALVTLARIQYATYAAVPFIGPPSFLASGVLSAMTGYTITPSMLDELVKVDDLSTISNALAVSRILGRDATAILNSTASKTAALLGQEYSDFFGAVADSLIANDRQSISGAAGASIRNLLGGDVGSVLSNWSSGLIGNDGAGLIGNDGAGLIGNDGAGLIGNDGAGLIGNDGAGLIGNDGAGLIGNDGAGLRSLLHP